MSPSRMTNKYATRYPLQFHTLTGEEVEVILIILKRYISRLKMKQIIETLTVHSVRIWDKNFRIFEVHGHNLDGDIKIKVHFQPTVSRVPKVYWTTIPQLDNIESAWASED